MTGLLWFGAAFYSPLQFLPSFWKFARTEVRIVGVGVKNLHLPHRTFIFGDQEHPIVGTTEMLQREAATNMVPEAITIFKLTARHTVAVPVYVLQHSLSWKFPEDPLIRRSSGDEDGATPLEAAILTSRSPHGLEDNDQF